VERSEWIVVSECLIYNWSQEENNRLANYTVGLPRSLPLLPYTGPSAVLAQCFSENPLNWPDNKGISANMTIQVKPI
jgi:hypothetical protein